MKIQRSHLDRNKDEMQQNCQTRLPEQTPAEINAGAWYIWKLAGREYCTTCHHAKTVATGLMHMQVTFLSNKNMINFRFKGEG
jgi:hypothetical protein